MKKILQLASGLALPLVVGVIWWYASADSTSVYYPPLKSDLEAFRQTWFFDHFRSDLVPSMIRFAIGFAVATFVGIGGGVLLGQSSRLRRALWPLTEFARSMPVAALVPIGLVVLGPGTKMEATIIAFAATWPILLNTVDGIRGTEPLQVEMAKVYGLSRLQLMRRVLLPAAMPQVFAGLRIALAIGLAAMVIGNMFGGSEGIGHFLVAAQAAFDMPSMWAGLLMIGALGAAVNLLFALVQSRVLAWHRGWRSAIRTAASR